MTVREEVLEQIIETIQAAEKIGQDGFRAVMATYPDTPEGVYWHAWAILDDRRIEGWWQQVEKTIDGEVLNAALLKSREPQ